MSEALSAEISSRDNMLKDISSVLLDIVEDGELDILLASYNQHDSN